MNGAASQSLVERLRAARESWCEVAPGKRVRLRRPLEWEMQRFRGGISLELVLEFVVGWEGFTEADLLPAGVGGPAVAEFSTAAAREALGDRHEWFNAVTNALTEAMRAHMAARESTTKN